MKKIVLLLLLIPMAFFAQQEKEIDSLKNVIATTKVKDEKYKAYSALLDTYLSHDIKKFDALVSNLLKQNSKNECLECEYLALYYTGHKYYVNQDVEKAVAYFEKSAGKSIKNNNIKYYQLSTTWIIQLYLNDGKLEEAEKYLNQLFVEINKNPKDANFDRAYFLNGILNFRKGFFNIAVTNYLKAENHLNKRKPDDYGFRSRIFNNVAQIYKELKNYKKAAFYLDQSYSLSQKSKDSFLIMNVTLDIGILEAELKNYKKATSYINNTYHYFKNINNYPKYLSSSAYYLGIVNYEISQYAISRKYFTEAKEIYKVSDDYSLAQTLSYLALLDAKEGNFEEAKKNINQAKSLLSKDKESPVYLEIITAEIKVYEKFKKIDLAYKSLKIRDSLDIILKSKSNTNTINELEAKYQNEKKEQQIKLLSTQNELAQKQKYIYIGLLGLLALIGGSLFYAYRNKIKTAQKLNELNQLKSRFFANISHEFRTPLTLIKSPVQSLQSEISNENQKNKLNLIDTNSTRMLELVDQLLELSKIDSGNLKLILKDGNVSSFITSLIEPFTFDAKEKEINFSSNIQKTTENNLFDKDVIEKIVTNLVTNAFKYTAPNEVITFSTLVADSNLKFIISNSGSDIKKEDLPKLFERFYQKNETQQGVGIGLALVKELVELYKGTIETTIHNGELSFIVNLPLSQTNENAIVIPSKVQTASVINSSIGEAELPILLIVDDNSEIRTVLKDIFKNDYQIIEAQDGEEALVLAQKEIPDCIISDVMMPKIDGFEFTKQIKSNELTSFIPVILLTAKTSDEAHLEGLKSTADAFLTKPFNNEIVKATVHQLIEERKKLHKRYSQELVLRPVDIVINSQEEKFIEKLQVILDKNLSNSEFTSEDFAAEIGMSRMQLHRKLKSLLGVSATEFLRNERLKVATELLKKGNGNISEVAYAVGFNDVSYFSKCFKEMYQCTPTAYIEKS